MFRDNSRFRMKTKEILTGDKMLRINGKSKELKANQLFLSMDKLSKRKVF